MLCPLSISHIRGLSQPQPASLLPSAEKVSTFVSCRLPSSVFRRAPSAASHTRRSFAAPVTSSLLSGEKASETAPEALPVFSVAISAPFAVFQSCAASGYIPDAALFPSDDLARAPE